MKVSQKASAGMQGSFFCDWEQRRLQRENGKTLLSGCGYDIIWADIIIAGLGASLACGAVLSVQKVWTEY